VRISVVSTKLLAVGWHRLLRNATIRW
jgi:hypothetical protein